VAAVPGGGRFQDAAIWMFETKKINSEVLRSKTF
jgi:hypothetical protein